MSHDLGMLIVRIIVGGAIAAHGAQKLFGWFGGHGIKGTAGFFESIGFQPGTTFAIAAGCSEFFGGVLILLGFLGPVGAMFVIGTMVVAMLTVHAGKGFFAMAGGIEVPFIYAAAALTTAFAGPGRFSIDYIAGLGKLDTANAAWIGLALGIIGALANMALRRAPATSQPAA